VTTDWKKMEKDDDDDDDDDNCVMWRVFVVENYIRKKSCKKYCTQFRSWLSSVLFLSKSTVC
jgi:hypothetical protein